MTAVRELTQIRNWRHDVSERPFIVIWEMTQACALACLDCRAEARPDRHSGELTAGIYRTSPLFTGLRQHGKLTGRCGAREFSPVCGGSRSRAFALSGDPYAEDPWCCYQPGTFPYPADLAAMGLRSAA